MSQKPWLTEDWWTSPFNHISEVRDALNFPKSIILHDVTLRDGEQTPGVVFTSAEKVRIAAMLEELGVGRIEAGMPAVSDDDAKAIKEISRLGGKGKDNGLRSGTPVRS